jgi:gamma-glutamyltranspeptidase
MGEIQPQVFAQFVSAMVDGASDIATAVAAPRWAALMAEQHGAPSISLLESRYADEVLAALRALGHRVVVAEAWDPVMGHAHAVELVRDAGEPDGPGDLTFAAAADPRSEVFAAAW